MAGNVHINNTGDDTTILLDGDVATAQVGGESEHGTVVVRDAANVDRVVINGEEGSIFVYSSAGDSLLHFNSDFAALYLGGQSNEGDLVLRDGASNDRIHLSAGDGDVRVRNASGDTLFLWNSSNAGLYLGGQSNEGDLILRDGAVTERIHLSAGDGEIRVRNAAGHTLLLWNSSNAGLYLGGQSNEGDLILRDEAVNERIHLSAGDGDIRVRNPSGNTLFLWNSSNAGLYLGGQSNEGDLILRDGAVNERIHLSAGDGDIRVKAASGTTLFHFDSQYAALYVGGSGNEGDVVVRNGDGNETIKLDGGSGDIILTNADCAEEFDIENAVDASPGSVMVIGDDERLTLSTREYDHRVAGVISGAGAYRPGIVLDRRHEGPPRPAVALMGKVYCKVDAAHGTIKVGDLLVSSPTPGHAMVAQNSSRWPGAVIGKALRGWDDGKGMIPCLVSLQ